MAGPAYFVLALLGCGDDEASCREVRVDRAQYTSVAQCNSAMATAITEHSDIPYPVVMGRCRQAGQVMAARNETLGKIASP